MHTVKKMALMISTNLDVVIGRRSPVQTRVHQVAVVQASRVETISDMLAVGSMECLNL